MRLFSTFFAFYLVVSCEAQWSYDTSISVQCTDGDTIPLGDCSSQFQRCRCNKWITSLCPDSSIFDPVTQLCVFDDIACVTTTSAPVSPSVPSSTVPPQYTTNRYTSSAPQYSTESYTTQGYTTTTPEYQSEASSTVGYITPAPYYPTASSPTPDYTSTAAPQYPTHVYPTAPQSPTHVYPTAPQSPTEAYSSIGYPTNSVPQEPAKAYPTLNSPVYPTSYPPQEPINNPGYTVQVQQNGLSNPFFVPKRFNRHYRHHHGYNRDGEIRVGKLPARSRSAIIDYRHHPVSDAFRAPDVQGIFSNDWDVFSRSRVHKKKSRKHHDDDNDHEEDDDDLHSVQLSAEVSEVSSPANPSASIDPIGDLLTPLHVTSDEDSLLISGDANGSGSPDEPFATMSSPTVRRKRSYLPVIEEESSRCSGTADNSIFSLGICQQNFIICRKSKELTAACPVGDLFDFETARCVPSILCGVMNAEICPTENPSVYVPPVTTTSAPTYIVESTPAYPTETTTNWVPAYPVESSTERPVYTTASFPVTIPAESSSTYPNAAYTLPHETSLPPIGTTTPVYTLPVTTSAPSHRTGLPYFPMEVPSHSNEIPRSTNVVKVATESSVPVITTIIGEPYYPVESTSRQIESKPEIASYTTNADTVIPSRVKPSTPKIIYVSVSSDPEKFCIGRGDSLYRDPDDCSGIVQCHGGEMFQHIGCPSGLVFNEIKQQCDYKNQVPECDLPNSAAQTGCRGAQHGAYLPDETDCTIFHRCVWNRLERMSCPTGTVFNPTLSVCDWPTSVPQCLPSSDQTRPSSPH